MRIALLLMIALLSSLHAAIVDEAAPPVTGVRLKDLCDIYGVRDNQLHGIGIVVGLSGTGDKSPATVGMLRQMLATKQLSFSENDLQTNSVAMVAVTADLPAFSRNGSRLNTLVSCLGNASSLDGGILLQTPLVGADEKIYAVGQGPVSVGGSGNAGPGIPQTGIDHKNQQRVANLTMGALVERELPDRLLFGDQLRLVLRNPDFTTASRVAQALGGLFGPERVSALDSTMVTVNFAADIPDQQLVEAIATLQDLHVSPDTKARVVINARTGTVVAGSQVRISAVAVSHGGLSLRVQPKTVRVVQRTERLGRPSDLMAEPETRLVYVDSLTKEIFPTPPSGTQPTQIPGSVTVLEGASVQDIANALNALGARPRDLVAIFEAVQRAGALHAELVVM